MDIAKPQGKRVTKKHMKVRSGVDEMWTADLFQVHLEGGGSRLAAQDGNK